MNKKREFLLLIDGCGTFEYEVEPIVKGINSYHIGVCKIEFTENDNTLHVHLRRPGLLIGRHGETINKIQKELECKIKLSEVELGR